MTTEKDLQAKRFEEYFQGIVLQGESLLVVGGLEEHSFIFYHFELYLMQSIKKTLGV